MILIHACKQREKYVNECLVPELKRQGFKSIKVHMDNNTGNLAAYLASYRDLPDHGDIWHLEDDVFPDGRFCEWAWGLSYFPGIIAGFGAGQYYGLRDFGYCVEPQELFMSFPCVRIPCETIKGFIRWYDDTNREKTQRAKTGKGIDEFFREYLISRGIVGFNFKPCMVEHVDDLIGGSIANKERINLKAAIFDGDLSPVYRWLS